MYEWGGQCYVGAGKSIRIDPFGYAVGVFRRIPGRIHLYDAGRHVCQRGNRKYRPGGDLCGVGRIWKIAVLYDPCDRLCDRNFCGGLVSGEDERHGKGTLEGSDPSGGDPGSFYGRIYASKYEPGGNLVDRICLRASGPDLPVAAGNGVRNNDVYGKFKKRDGAFDNGIL